MGRPLHFVSVQVKSTTAKSKKGYACTVRGGHASCPAGSFDFLAACVVFEDAWYIIPLEKSQGMRDVSLYPKLKKAKYEKYREAWNLLQPSAEDFSSASFDPLKLWRNRPHLERLNTYNLPTGNDSWSADPT